MTRQEAKKIMENEVRCVRNPNCERLECRNCYLVMPEHTVLKAYDVAIKALEQEPKTGKWIAQDIYNCHTDFKCSECDYIHSFMHLYGKPTADYTYCPRCGAKMVEPQESEEQT